MQTMQGVWLEDQQLSVRDDLPVPSPAEGEALVQVRLAGICATDLELVRGYYPFTGIPGHEFTGQVVEAPGGKHWLGRRVVGEISLACGGCPTCLAGYPSHCEHRKTLGIRNHHGAFAEFLILPQRNLHAVPEVLPDESAVFTEPLAAALEIQEQVAIQPGKRVLLIGAGRLGQLIARCLVLTGCHLQVVVRHAIHQQLLAQLGIPTLIEEEVGSNLWDIVIEATGSEAGFNLARRAVRPRGKIVLKSTFAGSPQINLSALVVDEIELIGSRCGPFPAALRLMSHKLIQPEPLISQRFPVSEAITAFQQAAKPGTLKVLLDMQTP